MLHERAARQRRQPPLFEDDLTVSLACFRNGKSLRKAARVITAAGEPCSHTTIASLEKGDRGASGKRLEAVLHRLGGMVPPGLPSDHSRRADALALKGLSRAQISEERARSLVEDAVTLWPAVLLREDTLPHGRRLTLGVATLLVLNTVADACPKIHDKLGKALLDTLDLASEAGRAKRREETKALAEVLFAQLSDLQEAAFISNDAETKDAEINGVRYLRHALLENLFGADLATIQNLSKAEQPTAKACAAARIVDADYIELANWACKATGGWASWKLGNALQLAVYAGDYDRMLSAAGNLGARFERFHLTGYGHDAPPAFEDRDLWIALAAIRRFSREMTGPLREICGWIDNETPSPVHASCLKAVKRLLEPDGLPERPICDNPSAEYPRLMKLIDTVVKG